MRASGSFFLLVRIAVIMVINFSAMQRKSLLLEKEIFSCVLLKQIDVFFTVGEELLHSQSFSHRRKKFYHLLQIKDHPAIPHKTFFPGCQLGCNGLPP